MGMLTLIFMDLVFMALELLDTLDMLLLMLPGAFKELVKDLLMLNLDIMDMDTDMDMVLDTVEATLIMEATIWERGKLMLSHITVTEVTMVLVTMEVMDILMVTATVT